MLTFFGFWHWKYAHISWFQEEGWTYISVDLFLFVLVYNTNFMNKHKFNDFDKKIKKKNYLMTVHFSYLQNHPTFNSEEQLINLERGREWFVGLPILFVYAPDLCSHCTGRKGRSLTSSQGKKIGVRRLRKEDREVLIGSQFSFCQRVSLILAKINYS